MMTPAMKSNQIEWFRKMDLRAAQRRYESVVDMFPVLNGRFDIAVVDIGCGPYGGVHLVRPYTIAVGVDPLWSIYDRKQCPERITRVVGHACEWHCDNTFDIVLSVNALQYEASVLSFFGASKRHLRSGGKLLLHLPCRRPDQVSRAHPFTHEPHLLSRVLQDDDDWIVERSEVHRQDPLAPKKRYHTLVVEAERR